ncbi:30S ribosomal protein S17 [Patescibacteria group bacterium]|nr:30S ribosomal protein S17 [Patescibacteria group bacterium]
MAVLNGKNLKEVVGTVTSDKMDKTIVVTVKSVKQHPLYRKRYTTKKKYYAHDDANTAHLGDVVKIRLDKPLSKTKRWALIEVVQQAI